MNNANSRLQYHPPSSTPNVHVRVDIANLPVFTFTVNVVRVGTNNTQPMCLGDS